MAREAVEFLGLLAVRAGAADYRTFSLDGRQRSEAIAAMKNPEKTVATIADDVLQFAGLLNEACGVPGNSPPG
jgi:hypothetical protein